jgi:hypothetical protein
VLEKAKLPLAQLPSEVAMAMLNKRSISKSSIFLLFSLSFAKKAKLMKKGSKLLK